MENRILESIGIGRNQGRAETMGVGDPVEVIIETEFKGPPWSDPNASKP
jgi:hypothetical protein